MLALFAAVLVQISTVDAVYKEGARPTEEELTGLWVTHAGFIHKDQELELLDAGSCATLQGRQTLEIGRFQVGKLGRMLAARTESKTSMVLMTADAIDVQLPQKSRCRLAGGAEGALVCRSDQGFKAWVKMRASCP